MLAVPAGKLTEHVGKYLKDRLDIDLEPGRFEAIIVVNDKGDTVAAIAFQNYLPKCRSVELSVVSETGVAWRPHVCRAIANYVFVQMGCIRATCATTKKNYKARNFLTHLGFELEGRLKRGYDGTNDALIYGLLAENCRFLADDSGES